ncbi:DUF2947 family protein [Vibrio hippocampi]|uniref:DUF2947 domain-containing protein n=1 Tax=Vibrio hippocampi TaxID=654686 RepID=A0ABM8ZHK2_9VIBR|nr:DUF2947 family protein [Vibrio hippocampi]CAH0525758.1 hypothetical protein VHP8226_01288 [Vibrio hippocampi]
MKNEIAGVFYDDPKMSSKDLDQIDILSEKDCVEKWSAYISKVSRHYMRMRDDEWPVKIVSGKNCFYHWLESWNSDNFLEFSNRLQDIGIPDNSTLIVFWMREIGLKTSWGVFRRNWGNFLYEDEGCILVLPERDESLVLSNGVAWLGKRSEPKT